MQVLSMSLYSNYGLNNCVLNSSFWKFFDFFPTSANEIHIVTTSLKWYTFQREYGTLFSYYIHFKEL